MVPASVIDDIREAVQYRGDRITAAKESVATMKKHLADSETKLAAMEAMQAEQQAWLQENAPTS